MKRREMILMLGGSFGLVAGLSACSPSQSGGSAPIAPPKAGMGQVVIYRPARSIGASVSFPMTLNGQDAGILTNGSVLTIDVEPGTYEVMAAAPSGSGTETVTIVVSAGQTAFVKGYTIAGVPSWRPELMVEREARARSEISFI